MPDQPPSRSERLIRQLLASGYEVSVDYYADGRHGVSILAQGEGEDCWQSVYINRLNQSENLSLEEILLQGMRHLGVSEN